MGTWSGVLPICVLAGLLGAAAAVAYCVELCQTQALGSLQNLYRPEPVWSLGLVTCGLLWSLNREF